MSGPDDLPDLIDAALDGRSTPEEWRRLQDRLRTDRAARAAYRQSVNLHCSLGRVYAGTVWSPNVRPNPEKSSFRRFAVVLAALAASVLVVMMLTRSGPPDQLQPIEMASARLAIADGSTELLNREGQSRLATDGEAIPIGHSVRTGPDTGTTVVTLGSGRLELGSDTTARFDGTLADASVYLSVGVARFDPLGAVAQSLLVQTPHASIRTRGTTFVSAVSADATLVEVEKGNLEIARASDGRVVEVGPGAWTVASTGGPMTSRSTFAKQAVHTSTIPIRANRVALSPDGSILAAANANLPVIDGVELWDVRTRRSTTQIGGVRSITALQFGPDGTTLAVGGTRPFVEIWDTGRQKAGPVMEPTDPTEQSIDLTFAGNGRWVAALGHKGITIGVRVWDTETGEPRPVPALAARAMSVSGTSKGPLLAGGTRDGRVVLWDAGTGREQAVLNAGRKEGFKAIAISPDGRRVAHPTGSSITVWNVARREIGRVLDGEGRWFVSSVVFSPNGKRIAAGGPTDVLVWDADTGAMTASVRTGTGTAWLAFTPDGRQLLTHSGGRTGVRVWNLPATE